MSKSHPKLNDSADCTFSGVIRDNNGGSGSLSLGSEPPAG